LQRKALELAVRYERVTVDHPCAYFVSRKTAEALDKKGLATLTWDRGWGTLVPTDAGRSVVSKLTPPASSEQTPTEGTTP
jgi:hypothetical protein